MKKKNLYVTLIFIILFMHITIVNASTEATNTVVGKIKEYSDVIYSDEDNNQTINVGDIISVGTESFYVVKYDEENGKVDMLAAKLVDINTYLQSDTAGYIKYSTQSKYYDDSLAKGYVENYTNKLNKLYNINATGSLVTKDDCNSLGGNYLANDLSGCPSWFTKYRFWTRSNFVAYYGNSVGLVYNTKYYEVDYTNAYGGLRPLITIDSSVLKEYNIECDKIVNGTVSVSSDKNKITIKSIPNEGYKITNLTVTAVQDNYNYAIDTDDNITYTFNFDKSHGDVIINASFELENYTISNETSTTNDSFTVNKTTANFGDLITITPTVNIGYEIEEVTVTDGQNYIPINVNNDIYTFTMPSKPVKIGVKYKATQFEFTKGQNSIYSAEDTTGIEFRITGPLTIFSKAYINGIELDEANYTLKSGSTILTLTDKYLKTLAIGEYTLKAEYTNGTDVETTFEIQSVAEKGEITKEEKDAEEKNVEGEIKSTLKDPTTGDNIVFLIILFVIALTGAVITFKLRKNNK